MAIHEEQSSGFKYDVFLSFRGTDTRYIFVTYLLDEFEKWGFNVFFDEKDVHIGERLSLVFSEAIKNSNVSVIVLSENYADSTWCLEELAMIMECTERNKKQLAVPIFYHVKESDVEKQEKRYGEAMVAHEKEFPEEVKAWRAALSEVANRKGHCIHTGPEIEHIRKIAKMVRAEIPPKPLNVSENLVGLDQCIEEAKSLLDLKPNDQTKCILGITGLEGIGKTEFAKVLYNKIVHQFQAACFLEDVGETSKEINGQKKLQKTLLSEMSEKLETKLGSTSRGIKEIKQKLGMKKVLLVLDGVDEMKQLENLAGGSDWFGPGSRIIITTWNMGLLDSFRPKDVAAYEKYETHKMRVLDDQHSLELFCRYAFDESNPQEGYEDLSSRFVGYAEGFPLALTVIGSNLRSHSLELEVWEDAFKEYKSIPYKGIEKVLEVSYKGLSSNAKSIFLDIACFFKGKRKEYVKEILGEFSAALNIDNLVNRSLLNVDNGKLNMHKLIQNMGRDIVMKESKYPANRSRLWDADDVIKVLSAEDSSGSDAIQGIQLEPRDYIREVYLNDSAFEKMISLRILIVQNITFSSESKHLPNYLRLLDWKEYPSQTLPTEFYPRKIVILKLTKSQLQMNYPKLEFSCLTVMNFSNNQSITTIPDCSDVKKLRELRLDYCSKLTTVHESIGFLQRLVHLSASACGELITFPQRMFLPFLEVLDLDNCEKLEKFPDIEDKMEKPLKIHMKGTSVKMLPNSVSNLIGLVSISMLSSKNLEYLPSSLFKLPNVVEFKFGGCTKLGESFRTSLLHSPSEAFERSTLKKMKFTDCGLSDEDIQAILICFPKLKKLTVSGNNLVSLPACIEKSNHLTELVVKRCKKLKTIPKYTHLRILNVRDCGSLRHISELPCTIEKVDARECFSISLETSDMLWDQVKKERHGLEIVMPVRVKVKRVMCVYQTPKGKKVRLGYRMRGIKVPTWFDHKCKVGIPCLWICGKFPIGVALSLEFQGVEGKDSTWDDDLVKLHLVINGQSQKSNYEFKINVNHVFVCDLRLLYTDDEWLGIDELLLEQEWNQMQISYEVMLSSCTLSEWGVFVYKQGIVNLEEHVLFECPDITKFSNIDNSIVPTNEPMNDKSDTEGSIDEDIDEIKQNLGF